MRLTPELIAMSPQFLNPVKDREIDIRGHKISVIENIGATKDQFDTMDLSDNEIRKLENIPLLKRLKSLFLNNNRISYINGEIVAQSLPSLETLILTNNLLRDVSQIESLQYFSNLKSLSLIDNLVTKRDDYRLYVIHLVPSLKYLDFQKVKKQEREKALKIFGDVQKKQKTMAPSTTSVNTFEPGKSLEDSGKLRLTQEQIKKLQTAISNAKSYADFTKYSQALKAGIYPRELDE